MNQEELFNKIDSGELTADDINNMDLSGINIDISVIDSKISYWNTYQLALKISINALYGAIANVHFPLFNRDVAASITGNGRVFIQGLADYVNEKLKKLLKEKKDFILYGDTDSVLGNTVIISEAYGEMQIQKYFDVVEGKIQEIRKDNFIKHIVYKDRTYSISKDGSLNKNKIRYVMKHKVQKRFYKISVFDKSVVVTEDHSIIVKRNNEIIDCKPNEIKEGDFLIHLGLGESSFKAYLTNEYTVQDLGIKEEWVYDLEVENDHNFFGNDICVHNSIYFTLEPLVQKLQNGTDLEKSEILKKLINFDKKYLDKWVQEYIDIFSETFNAFNKDVIGAKLEKISESGFFVAKKKYALRTIWDEGAILLDHPKLSLTGLEIVRSSTPKFCQEYLKEMTDVILDNPEKETVEHIKNIESEFYKAHVEDIARVSGIGSLDYEGDIGNFFTYKNGKTLTAPMNVRAAKNYNLFIKRKGLKEFPEILETDKIKYVFLKQPNPLGDDVVAFLDSRFLEQTGLIEFLDKERMWETFFISPLKIMLEAVGYDINKNFAIEEWL